MPRSITKLLEWCETEGIKIDPRVELRLSEEKGMSVWARGDIEVNETSKSNDAKTR